MGRRDSTRRTPWVGVGGRCALSRKLILVFQTAILSTLQEKYTVDHDCIVLVMKQELDCLSTCNNSLLTSCNFSLRSTPCWAVYMQLNPVSLTDYTSTRCL